MAYVRPRILYIALIILFAALALAISLRKSPNSDEAWFFSPVYNFLNHGTTGTTILDATGMPWSGVEKYTYWQVPFYFVAEAGWMKVFGLNLFAMRSLSIVAGLAAVLLWLAFFRLLGFEQSIVTLTAIVILCDYAIITRSAEARMDMLSGAFGAGALAAYSRWRTSRFSLSIFLSQSGLALSGLSHPMGGMVYSAAFAVLFLMNGDWRRLRFGNVALAVLPYALGAACWGAYIAHDPALFVHVFRSNTSGRFNGILSPFQSLWREFYGRYLGSFGLNSSIGLARAKLIIPVTYIGGVIVVARLPILRRYDPARKALVLLAAMAATMMLVDDHKFGNYLVHIFPLYAVLLATIVLFAWRMGGKVKLAAAAGLAGFVGLQLLGSVYWISRDSYHKEFLPLARYVSEHAASSARIDAPAELAFAFGFEGKLKDDVNLGVLSGWTPNLIVQNGRYREWLQLCMQDNPALYRALTERLHRFRPAYQVAEYIVFLPASPEPEPGRR